MDSGVVNVGIVPALCLLAGATLGAGARIDAWACAWVLPPACLAALVVWRCRRAPWGVFAIVALGFLAGGAALGSRASDRALHTSLRDRLDTLAGGFLIESNGPAGRHDPVLSRAVLVEDASRRDGFVSLRVEVEAIHVGGVWTAVAGGVVVSVSGSAAVGRVEEWRAGRTIETPIAFRRPARYLNAGVPDFEHDSALDGATLLGSVKSALLVDVVQPGGRVSELAADVRAYVRRAVTSWIAPHDAISAAIATAVLIGDRTGLPDETREALQAAGTYHVIAISGGNIAILAAAATLCLLVAGVRGRRAAVGAIVALSLYALVVTAGPSVWRATLMAVLYFAARAIDHRTGAWQTASVAAALMVAGRPLDGRDAGFILTFGATLALLHGARAGADLKPRIVGWVAASVAASMAIEIALLPVSAWFFSRVTGAGLVLNLLAVPLMGIVQMAALVVTLADGIPAIAGPSGWLAHMAARSLVESAGLVTLAPWSSTRVPPPHVIVVCVYYGALAILLVSSRRPLRACAAVAWGLSMLIVAGAIDPAAMRPTRTPSPLRLTMIDVGQGESLLLELPGGRRMLVDAGGALFGGGVDIGARVVSPAVWARGVRSLDTVLITHGDPDHAGGASDVLSDFTPRQLWMGVPVPNHAATSELERRAERLGIPVRWKNIGSDLIDGDVAIRVLHPPMPDWERRRVRNDDSVVLEVLYRDVALLLTGDISAESERELLPGLTHARHRILKVAHHGSRTSSSRELLSAWRPQIALISAGRGNTFGHPAREVLERLAAIGADVFRTDLHGQVTLVTDGREVEITTFVQESNEPRRSRRSRRTQRRQNREPGVRE